MLGIIDVGGGTRGIFGAGVFDYCMDHGITFDMIAGISAGSANAASFLAGQRGRNYTFYQEYAFRKDYMSLRNLLRDGSYIDLEYIYGKLSNHDGENPLDYQKMIDNPAGLIVVATDVDTGKPVYFRKEDMKRDTYFAFKASCCVPVLNKPYRYRMHSYFDGGISDPIPIKKLMEMGCDRIVLILTRPKDYFRKEDADGMIVKLLQKKYPAAAEAMKYRSSLYNRQLKEALRLEEEGKVLIIAPDTIEGLKTLTKDHGQMESLYQKGYQGAAALPAWL